MTLCKTTLSVEGMTCGACVTTVVSSLEALDGVDSASVTLMTSRAVVVHSSTIEPTALAECIEDCGFEGAVLKTIPVDGPEDELLGPKPTPQVRDLKLKIFGMTCSACSNTVESVLREVPGVESAIVALTTEMATIVYDDSQIAGPRVLIDAVQDAGFDAILAKSADNTAQIMALDRVKEIKSYYNNSIICLCLSIPVVVLTKMVPNVFGFLAFLKTPVSSSVSLYWDDVINFVLTFYVQFGVGRAYYIHAYKALKHKSATMDLLVSVSTTCAYSFSILSILYALVTNSGKHPSTLWETSAMIFTFVVFGKYLECRAKGQTSVALSRLISLVPSTATIYENPTEYLNCLKQFSTSKETDGSSSPALDDLREKVISTDLLQVGDIVIVRPGEKVSADGIVVSGSSYLSEALVTGESYPILKTPGEAVIGGSVNGRGKIDVRVTRAGDNTRLSQIVNLVRDAQESKAPVQRFADWAAGYFVPVVIILAILTFVTWMVVAHVLKNRPAVFDGSDGPFMVCLRLCISVIVVACPCALGLATPTAVMVATGVGAQHGILIKGGSALEVGSRIQTVLFDKTGTLTLGKMSVTRAKLAAGVDEQQFWMFVGSLEQGSEHPIAKSLAVKAKEMCNMEEDVSFSCRVDDFQAAVGEGVTGTVTIVELSGSATVRDVAIGNLKMLQRLKVEYPEGVTDVLSSGDTVAFAVIGGEYAGWICLSDPLKPEAATTVAALRRMGLEVGIVSGDNLSVAVKVAQEVGVDRSMVFAGMSPSGKIKVIKRLQDSGDEDGDDQEGFKMNFSQPRGKRRYLAMVGDGINDSPALAAASLGISMAGATDVAMEAADVVLLRDDALLDIPAAIDLSRRAYGRIKLNLMAAVVYNVIMLPFAMGFFLPFGVMLHPMMASAAMALSSVSVLMSSLMLQQWKPKWRSETTTDLDTEPMQVMSIVDPRPIQGWRRFWPWSSRPHYDRLQVA